MSEKFKENPKIETDLISLRKAAKYCDYTQEYLSLRARQGKLKAVKFARNWLTKKEWIEEYVREMEEYQRNQRKRIEVKPELEEKARFIKGISISLPRISLPPKLKPALALALILLLLFSSIALGKESLKTILQDTVFYIQQIPKTINYVLKESKKSLASSLDSLNQSFVNVAQVIKTTDYQDLKTPIPLFKEYFKWLGTSLKHQVLTFSKGGGRFVKQIKEGALAFGQATKELTYYIYNLALRTPDLLVRGVTESIPALTKKIVDFGSYTSDIFKKGWQNLVLKFQAGREELKNFITRLFKPRIVKEKPPEKEIVVEVTKEEFEKLKQEIETIKKEGLPVKEIIKEVEVSKITKIEPIKEITKEIRTLEEESLKRIQTALSQQETDVEKLKLAASAGYVNVIFPTTLPLEGDTTITTLGTITTGTWNGDVITTTYGGSGADLSAGAQGGVLYMGASSIMGISATGTSGYALISGGTGVPTWTNTPNWSTITLSTSVTSPLIYGSSAASGNLTLRTTSDVTKGSYILSELTSDGFVKTTGGTGTLNIDTTSYQPAGTYVTSVTGTSPITSTEGTSPDIGITQTLITNLNSALATGLLKITNGTGLLSTAVAGTDYQAPGDYITALTGEVTATGPGSVAATITSQTSEFWLGKVSDETGTGKWVFGTSPEFTTKITSPLIYGSSADAGTLTLEGSSYDDGSDTYILLNPGGGDVGIGTATPEVELEVNGDILLNKAAPALRFYYSSGQAAYIAFKEATSNRWQIISDGSTDDFMIYSYGISNYPFVIDYTTGNVGIGTATPNEQLEITGNLRLPTTTATTGIIKLGANRFIHNYGNNNVFIGENAGNLTMTTAEANIGVGRCTLLSNTLGDDNVAIGDYALWQNTLGSYNVAIGGGALNDNLTANELTAVGYQALANTTGWANTALGNYAGFTNATGTLNTLLGYWADVGSGNLTNATAIGAYATVDTSDSLVLGGTGSYAVNVGIGTATPGEELHIQASSPIIKFDDDYGGVQDKWDVGINVNSKWNHFLIWNQIVDAGFTFGQTGNFGIGTTGPVGVTKLQIVQSSDDSSGAIRVGASGGYGATLGREVGSTGAFILANQAIDTVALKSGDVGIGTTTPGYKLDVAGQAHATDFPTSSDIRFKDNVVELTNILEKLEKVRGVTFEWNDLYGSLGRAVPGTQIGMIAQELEQVYPELVTTWSADGVDDYRGIEYGRFSAVLLEGLKELHGEVEELREIIGPLDGEGTAATDNQLLITDYSITDNFIARIKQALASLGIFIENGIAKVKRLIAEVVQLDKLEMRDQATGEVYCTWIEQGEWVKQLGKCQDVLINSEVQPSVDYGAGASGGTSDNQLESSENQLEEKSVPEEPPAEEQPTEELPTEKETATGETAQEAVEEELSAEEPVQEEMSEESSEVEPPITEEPVIGESVIAD